MREKLPRDDPLGINSMHPLKPPYWAGGTVGPVQCLPSVHAECSHLRAQVIEVEIQTTEFKLLLLSPDVADGYTSPMSEFWTTLFSLVKSTRGVRTCHRYRMWLAHFHRNVVCRHTTLPVTFWVDLGQ